MAIDLLRIEKILFKFGSVFYHISLKIFEISHQYMIRCHFIRFMLNFSSKYVDNDYSVID